MKDLNDLLGELGGIVESRSHLGVGTGGWDDDLRLYSLASLIEQVGDVELDNCFEGLVLTPDNAEEKGVKLGDFFVPPAFIRNAPFKDSISIWYEAAAEVLRSGKAFDDKQRPNYGQVVSIWKNRIEEIYGYRPSASKEKSFAQDIESGISQAASLMAKRRAGKDVGAEAVKKAAKLLGAKSSKARGAA